MTVKIDNFNVTTSNKFKSNNRLLNPKDYKYVFNAAYKSSNKHFIILGRKNKCENSRLGLAISKKSLRLAVSRNYIKRIIREVFRQMDKEISTHIDYVVMARKDITNNKKIELIKSLEKNFTNIIKHFN